MALPSDAASPSDTVTGLNEPDSKTILIEALNSILAASPMLESHHDMLERHNDLLTQHHILLCDALLALAEGLEIEEGPQDLLRKHNNLLVEHNKLIEDLNERMMERIQLQGGALEKVGKVQRKERWKTRWEALEKIGEDEVLTEVGKRNMRKVIDNRAMLERHEFLVEEYVQLCEVDVERMDRRRLWICDLLKQYEALGGEVEARLEECLVPE